jgi:hypothetical protein
VEFAAILAIASRVASEDGLDAIWEGYTSAAEWSSVLRRHDGSENVGGLRLKDPYADLRLAS